jgi:hypothetical protein
MQNNEVDIAIDEFTACLVNRVTGEWLDTEVSAISVKPADYKGWRFDWGKERSIFALRIKGEKEIQGLISCEVEHANRAVHINLVEASPKNIGSNGKYDGVGGHLFAEAIKQSIDTGYGGYVYFTAKTNLIAYYQEKLGAVSLSGQVMAIEEQSAKKLYDRYYGGTK